MPNNEELASGLNDSSIEPSGKESPKVLWLVAGLAVDWLSQD